MPAISSFYRPAPGLSHFLGQFRIASQPVQGGRDGVRIAGRDHNAGAALLDNSTGRRRRYHDRQARRHGLQQSQRHAFFQRRQAKNPGSGIDGGQGFARNLALDIHGIAGFALEETLKLQSSETILIQGGAGGVAGIAIQLAKYMGAHVITTASPANHDYVRALGADETKILVTGSIKFDGDYTAGHEDRLARARELTAGRPVLLGASTHEGEEQALLDSLPALERILPNVLLILAPRHTHRTDQVRKQCQSSGCHPRCLSETTRLENVDRVLILDVMGQLESYFPVTKVAFIGGSLIPVGGHNLLEAVRARAGVIMGPHLDNVEDITRQFIDRGAMRVVDNSVELGEEIMGLMLDEDGLSCMVNAAGSVLDVNRGSIDRNVELIVKILEVE